MFKKIEAFGSSGHQDLRFSKSDNFSFASKVNLVQLSFSEIKTASRFYPIVFPSIQPELPHAVLSLTPENNNYVTSEGKWTVPYIPFFIRTYPFTMIKTADKDKYAVCIDAEAPHFQNQYGEILFTADGKPNDFSEKIINGLKIYLGEIENTKKLFSGLAEKDLMVDKQITFGKDSDKKSIGGFKVIEMEKILELPDSEIAELVKNGAMGLIYDHLSSLSNMNMLAGK
ncbi:MAG: SapC family protein [Desulfobacteraceae bacterium]|nr:SapC family protein [Desulfobacteraceae bacterium]MCB9494745.1 SapC family protein [Desulfobacteraceae bacterium]